MNAYVDTSVVAKLMVEEPGSERAAILWDSADIVVGSRLLYVEVRAALAAARRAARLTVAQHRRTVANLEGLWAQMIVVEVSLELVAHAAVLAESDRLHSYDAVHLASALLVGAGLMATPDVALATAASRHGLHVVNPDIG